MENYLKAQGWRLRPVRSRQHKQDQAQVVEKKAMYEDYQQAQVNDDLIVLWGIQPK